MKIIISMTENEKLFLLGSNYNSFSYSLYIGLVFTVQLYPSQSLTT